MKRLSNFFESAQKIDIQDETLPYIGKQDLEKYLSVTSKFLTPEAKKVVQYLIDHNDTFTSDFFELGEYSDNPLANFYLAGVPKDPELKQLYKAIGVLKNQGKLLSIPVFQNKEQFNDILKGKISLDSIVLDLTSDAGRNKVAKDFQPLIHKIAKQLVGVGAKTSYDDLISAGNEGLVYAMNDYGKTKSQQQHNDEAELSDLDADIEKSLDSDEKKNKKAQYTFVSYAAYRIRFHMLAEINDNSRTIKISKYLRKKEEEKGNNTRENTISGDQTVRIGKDGETQTLFNKLGDVATSDRTLDDEDQDYLMQKLYKELEKKFSKTDLDCFYGYFGLNGHTDEDGNPIKGKDLAKKYNTVASNITYRIHKIITYIMKDPKLKQIITDVNDLFHESLHDKDVEDGPDYANYIIDKSTYMSIYDFD